MDYDVIIASGSFAGLAAAVQLKGKRVLLVEPHPIGAVQTSACGTLLAVLEATGTDESLIRVHNQILIHLDRQTVEFQLEYPFCTFDYATFCHRLLRQCAAHILRASVLGHRGHIVFTSEGTFDAEILVDASGWRAALATCGQTSRSPIRGMSFGLETIVPVSEKGLHFYYDPKRLGICNVGWLFSLNGKARAGFGTYLENTRLKRALSDFTRTTFGASQNGCHGGYFPYQSQPATTGHVFRVGDAAGQCLPLTGEGIRPALYFSMAAARLIRRVLAGEMREPDALREYRRFVRRHQGPYRFLLAAQWLLPRLPLSVTAMIARQFSRPLWLSPALRAYWRGADPGELVFDQNDNARIPGASRPERELPLFHDLG